MASPEFDLLLKHFADLFGNIGRTGRPDVAEIVALQRRLITVYTHAEGRVPQIAEDTRVIAADANGVAGDWVVAANANPAQRLMWVHGGAWMSGTPADYHHLAEYVGRAMAAAVFLPDYRLAPEHPFPAGLDDTRTGWNWLPHCGPQGKGAAERLWLAGDSAGANLVLSTVQALIREGAPLPEAVVTLGAATDLTASGKSMITRAAADPVLKPAAMQFIPLLYVQDGTPKNDPRVSPLFGDMTGLPPTLMHVGDREVLLDDTLRFAERAQAAGSPVTAKVWPEMTHVFELFCHMLPEARQSLDEVAAFMVEA